MPPVIKWLIAANVIIFVLPMILPATEEPIFFNGALWPWASELFRPWQYITTMFLHGGFMHLLLNMFILWMFGIEIAQMWGTKKFLVFYFLSGIGASLLHSLVTSIEGGTFPAVGASGAIFGVLVAFGMLYPNRMVFMMFLFPMKAKYAVMIFIVIDLFMGMRNVPGDNIAHFAHLGGALAGFLLMKSGAHGKIASVFGGEGGSEMAGSSGASTPWVSTPPPRQRPVSRTDRNESARIIDARFHDVSERTPANRPVSLNFGDQQEQVDAILDKISREGYNALTPEEKKILTDASNRS